MVLVKLNQLGGEYYKPTDYYYADLTWNWDGDGDGIWGENPSYNTYSLDEIEWIPEVYVGRLPASTATELEIMVNKTLKYEIDPFVGEWMNKMLLAGALSSSSPLEDEAVLTTYISNNYTSNEMNFTHLHRESSSFDPPMPSLPNRQEDLTSTNIQTELDLGYSTAIIASHGIFSFFQDNYGNIFTESQAGNLNNINMPFLLYGDACTTASYDVNDNNIGERLIKLPNAGAIGYVGGLRVNWYFDDDENLEKLNRGNAKLFWKEFFLNKKFQQGRTLYDSKVAYINSDYYVNGSGSTNYDYERKNLLTYNLLGDPEVDIYTDIPKPVENPFIEGIYEGQLVSVTIKDVDGENIPYARVYLEGAGGKCLTQYANINGSVNFRMLVEENETYNVMITGHNLVPSYFNFTTLPDNDVPELRGIQISPSNPRVQNNITFDIDIFDNSSGIESVYVIISNNNFQNFSYFSQLSCFFGEERNATITVDQLPPGDYLYFIFARDYANNTNNFYDNSLRFSILTLATKNVNSVSVVIILVVIGISSYLSLKKIRKHSLDFK